MVAHDSKEAGQLPSPASHDNDFDLEKSMPPESQLENGHNDSHRGGGGDGSMSSSSSTSAGGEEFEVKWEGQDDPGNPRSMSKFRKWLCTWVVSLGSLCVYVSYNANCEFRMLIELIDITGHVLHQYTHLPIVK
jgi:hypothetical protein